MENNKITRITEEKEAKNPLTMTDLANKLALANNAYAKYAKDKAEKENKECYVTYMSLTDAVTAMHDLVAYVTIKEDKVTKEKLKALLNAYQTISDIQPEIIQKLKYFIKLNK